MHAVVSAGRPCQHDDLRTWVSCRKPLGMRGLMGRSIKRDVSTSWSRTLPSRLSQPPLYAAPDQSMLRLRASHDTAGQAATGHQEICAL